jgi:glycosyltransferase 2 family protein
MGHRGALAAAALVGLALSALEASLRPVPGWELRLARWADDLPDAIATALYPVMQLGTLGAPVLVAVIVAVVLRRWVLTVAVLVTGVVAWFAAKGVKEVVGRGRPREYLPEIVVRDGDGLGLGYISGHSTVAASMALLVAAALPPRARPWAAFVAVLVGLARMVEGVHLAADVVGGWSTGVLLGLVALEVVERVEDRLAQRAPAPA